jgi:hypothetical protein
MDIEIGIQANCSETSYQICGIHTGNVAEFKRILREELLFKYNEDYLDDYINSIASIKGKYALYLRDGNDDLDEIIYAAGKVGASYDYISCCSNYLDSDEEMEQHLKNNKSKIE